MSGSLELIETATPAAEAGCRPMVWGRCGGAGADLPATGPLAAIAFDSPLGRMVIEADGLGVRALRWGQGIPDGGGPPMERWAPLLAEARDQVRAYFEGRLRRFTLPLAPQGTRFQRTVWGFINEIPHGVTLRYGELAELTGSAPRAVARACGANPLPLVIPCHRVVGAMTDLGGYSAAGGVMTKRFLLRLEGALDGPARGGPGAADRAGAMGQRSFEF
jgi:methylated-DNA-[protein]-cysteine S-methyltransferase